MSIKLQKLELAWIGKDEQPRVERLLEVVRENNKEEAKRAKD